MPRELSKIYNDLLNCHVANLYSFYFKLYKYEQFFKKKMDLDISPLVDNTIDVLNEAIHKSEKVYGEMGVMPELSMTFLTSHSVVSHQFQTTQRKQEIITSLEEDQASIEKTLELTIYCSDTLALVEESDYLCDSQMTIHSAFETLKGVLQ